MADYYTTHAQEFFDATVGVDMQSIYQEFLPLLPDGAHILDAGCGSGRDTLAFIERGYAVDAFDASPALCRLASSFTGIDVACTRFESWSSEAFYDGIWACASLLHLPPSQLVPAMSSLILSLKRGGVLYCSFKSGDEEREVNGRHFTDLNQALITKMISKIDGISLIKLWESVDQRPSRDEVWLNAVIRRN